MNSIETTEDKNPLMRTISELVSDQSLLLARARRNAEKKVLDLETELNTARAELEALESAAWHLISWRSSNKKPL